MSISADNRTVIITGASSGIGFALAEAYLEKGCNVVGNARTIDRLKTAAEKLGNRDNFLPVDGDISLELTARKLFERAIAAFGKVDILINNAGIFETLIMPRSSAQPSPGPILPLLTTSLVSAGFVALMGSTPPEERMYLSMSRVLHMPRQCDYQPPSPTEEKLNINNYISQKIVRSQSTKRKGNSEQPFCTNTFYYFSGNCCQFYPLDPGSLPQILRRTHHP
jgi:hypothetical protein